MWASFNRITLECVSLSADRGYLHVTRLEGPEFVGCMTSDGIFATAEHAYQIQRKQS